MTFDTITEKSKRLITRKWRRPHYLEYEDIDEHGSTAVNCIIITKSYNFTRTKL